MRQIMKNKGKVKKILILLISIFVAGFFFFKKEVSSSDYRSPISNNPSLSQSDIHGSIPGSKDNTNIKYIPDEIIIKFKETVEQDISTAVSRNNVNISSLSGLNKKFKVKKASPLFRKRIGKTTSQAKKAFKAMMEKAKARSPETIKHKPEGGSIPDLSNIYVLKTEAKIDVLEAVKEYSKDPNVEYAEPNYLVYTELTVPDDPGFAELWGLHNTGQTGGTADADIDAPEAWDITTGSSTIVVAVIDTGVDYNHPELAANMWTNPGEIPGNGIDDDSNGYIDDEKGWDFITCEKWSFFGCEIFKSEDNDPYDDSAVGHGTHCAGTIAASGDNGTGVAGVNWNLKIMPLRSLNIYGQGTISDEINSILYAIDNGAVIMSNSWGGTEYSEALKETVQAASDTGILFVAAAGNSSVDNDSDPHYPAGYEVQNIISVAATDHNDDLASFSNYGTSSVDLGAPGVDILSTLPHIDTPSGLYYSGTYKLIYFGFGFEDIEGTSRRESVMQKILSYYGLQTTDPILILDDDDIGYKISYYTDALNALGYVNHTVTLVSDCDNGPTSSTMSGYGLVIWVTGADSDCTITDTDQAEISSFLDSGGNLFLSGQNIGYEIGSTLFYADYLKAEYINFYHPDNTLNGSGIFQGESIELSVYVDNDIYYRFNDRMNPIGGALPAFTGDSYTPLSGTSMATPHVAGVAALLLSNSPGLNIQEIKSRILLGADDVSSLSDKTYTGGRLNAHRTLAGPYSPPRADFFARRCGPPEVRFTNDSLYISEPSWLWDFGDGETSTEKNPTNTYTAEGTYTVSLTLSNTEGTDIKTKDDYVTVWNFRYCGDTLLFVADASFTGENEFDNSGYSISSAGDVNGDGYDDIIIGAEGNSDGAYKSGQTYLILGKSAGWGYISLSEADASFTGVNEFDNSGKSVSSAGDVNGDGYDDILIGVPNASTVYLILGKQTGWLMDTPLNQAADASFLGNGWLGHAVSSSGDVNGDGYDDIIISAPLANGEASVAGKTYLILGKASGWAMDTDINNADASFLGEGELDKAGWSVSSSGDVNGDGYDDILIGSHTNDEGGNWAGQTYLIFGKPTGWTLDTPLRTGSDASFIGETGYRSGLSVSLAGDINSDGYDDILIGAPYEWPLYPDPPAGKAYLIFGKQTGWSMDTLLSTVDASFNGTENITTWGADNTGIYVSPAGDINGDGYDDFIIGDDMGSEVNQSGGNLFFGRPGGWHQNMDITEADVNINGGGKAAFSAGDVNGDGMNDLAFGTYLNDEAAFSAGKSYVMFGGLANGTVNDGSPTGSIRINNYDCCTNSSSVNLTLSAFDTDGVASMCISNTMTCSAWEPYAASKSWTLDINRGDGFYTVFAWFKDSLGNFNAYYWHDSILFDATVPLDGTLSATERYGSLYLLWSGFSDYPGRIDNYKLVYSSNSMPADCSSGNEIYYGPATFFYHTSPGSGPAHYYRVCATDNAGNISAGATTIYNSQYDLTTSVVPTGGGTITPDCSNVCWYDIGTQVTLTATELNGSAFSQWTGCDNPSGQICYLTMDSAKNVTAEFITQSDEYYVEAGGNCGGNTPCYPTIQSAMDAAGGGETIKVARGTYYEHLTIFVRSVTGLLVEGGWSSDFSTREDDPSLTVIDGNGHSTFPIFRAYTGYSHNIDVSFKGFTLTNNGHRGVAVESTGGTASVHLENNIITGISGNAYGTGLFVQSKTGYVTVSLTNNIIADNSTIDAGGGIYAYAQDLGTAILFLSNNTITGNSANNGGGIYIYSALGSMIVDIENTIIQGNNATMYGDDIYIWENGTSTTVIDVAYSDINDVYIISGTYNEGNGMINADPLFVNPGAGDYHLSENSPCIDTGTDTGAPLYDFEGDVRPIDGDSDLILKTDIGADEYEGCLNLPVMIAGTFYSTLQAAYNASVNGDIIKSQAVTFTENLHLDVNKSITLEAGHDCDYLTSTGETVVRGDITIDNGTLIIDTGILTIFYINP
jgi:subtilisin family serine protease